MHRSTDQRCGVYTWICMFSAVQMCVWSAIDPQGDLETRKRSSDGFRCSIPVKFVNLSGLTVRRRYGIAYTHCWRPNDLLFLFLSVALQEVTSFVDRRNRLASGTVRYLAPHPSHCRELFSVQPERNSVARARNVFNVNAGRRR